MSALPYDPPTAAAHVKKWMKNQRISGYGLDVSISVPCPFCAEPDWLTHKLLDTQEAYVQTSGPDGPDYLPKMRRVDG